MTEEKKGPGRPKIYKVKVDGVIADGKGGYLAKGDELPDGCDIPGLEAKGLV